MTREVDFLIAYHEDSGAPGVVTDVNTVYNASGTRIHAANSWHYQPGTPSASGSIGTAVDFGFHPPQRDSPSLYIIYNSFLAIAGQLEELIYAGTGVTKCVSRGQLVRASDMPPDVMVGHHDHVHVAVRPGHFVSWTGPIKPVLTQQEALAMANEKIPNAVDACPTRDGTGWWIVAADGGVATVGSATFYGSYVDLKPEYKLGGPRQFLAVAATDKGYSILATDGAAYAFDADMQAMRVGH